MQRSLVQIGSKTTLIDCIVRIKFLSSSLIGCGSFLTQQAGVNIADLWEESIPATDRTLWNAKLFSICLQGLDGSINVIRELDNSALKVSTGFLTWMQHLSSSTHADKELMAQWRATRRLSLADILKFGDAMRMFQWRLWLQVAFKTQYGQSTRIVRCLGATAVAESIYAGFLHVVCFLQNVDFAQDQAPKLLLQLWLAQLCLHGVEEANCRQCLCKISECFLREIKASFTSASPERYIMTFRLCCNFIREMSNPEISNLVLAFLKTFLVSNIDICSALRCLKVVSAYAQPNMQSRVVFLSAWLTSAVKLSTQRLNATQTSLTAQHSNKGLRNAGNILQEIISTIEEDDCNESNLDGSSDRDLFLSGVIECAAQRLIEQNIQDSLLRKPSADICFSNAIVSQSESTFKPLRDVTVVIKSPVRIDIAGGWSDTPPICYEQSGSVSFC